MSSNSSACQGLQSCLNPLISKPDLSFSWFQNSSAENQKNDPIRKNYESNISGEKSIGCWNVVQALTNTSYDCRQLTNESKQVYVHPLSKLSTSSLSTRSLEMCTETLGSETGSSIDPNLNEYSYLELERQSTIRINQPKIREFCKKIRYNSSFPPPLTSISGNNGVKVQTHREGGRLVITAFTFSACRIYFKAERKNGRLRLSLLKDYYRHSEHELVESLKENGVKLRCKSGGGKPSTSRCNEDGSGRKKLPSLPVCVAFS